MKLVARPRGESQLILMVVVVFVRVMVMVAVVVADFAIVVPGVVVRVTAMVVLPIALIVHLPVMSRGNPDGARIRRTGPIALMPLIVVADRVPISLDPDIAGTRSDGSNRNYPGWRRRADPNSDPDRDLGEGGASSQKH